MVDRVEHGDDVAVDVERVRHVHLAADGAAHAVGDHRLAVAGRAVEEHGLVRVDRGAELLEDVIGNHQVRESVPQPLAIDVAARLRQRAHRRDIAGQRHRRRPDVAVDLQVLARPVAAGVGQRVAVAGASSSDGAADLDETLGAHALENELEDAVLQAHPIGKHQAGRFAAVQRLDQQLLDLVGRQAGIGQRDRHLRCRGSTGCHVYGGKGAHLLAIGKRT